MSSCVFCDIVSGKLPARTVYEDAEVLGFWDIRPMAPTHLLFIPKRHITSLAHVESDDWAVVTACLQALTQVARERGVADTGYRVVVNVGDNGGQTVKHLHCHLLADRFMTWPPG